MIGAYVVPLCRRRTRLTEVARTDRRLADHDDDELNDAGDDDVSTDESDDESHAAALDALAEGVSRPSTSGGAASADSATALAAEGVAHENEGGEAADNGGIGVDNGGSGDDHDAPPSATFACEAARASPDGTTTATAAAGSNAPPTPSKASTKRPRRISMTGILRKRAIEIEHTARLRRELPNDVKDQVRAFFRIPTLTRVVPITRRISNGTSDIAYRNRTPVLRTRFACHSRSSHMHAPPPPRRVYL